ncbi:PAS domain-containing protein [Azospirillum sp. ST 5-10]|uniref:PAS domain-containing protein n=1 Tax=unclassified Azospirillum TaxID=2630922 RepID=UPI003F49C945
MPTVDLIEAAWSHWERMAAGRAMPSRADLDPVDVPRLLPFTILVEVLRDPLDFRYRLLGTELDRIVAGNFKGRRFSEIPRIGRGGQIWRDHAAVVETRRPLRATVRYIGDDAHVRGLAHGLFPLSNDGESVTMIWCVAQIDR